MPKVVGTEVKDNVYQRLLQQWEEAQKEGKLSFSAFLRLLIENSLQVLEKTSR
jgi:predicted CopG family antitoxin